MKVESTLTNHSTAPLSVEKLPSIDNLFDQTVDQFFGFFKWVTSWIDSGFYSSSNSAPFELTPQQKLSIEKIYHESLQILKELDHPEHRDDVRSFMVLLLDFYQKRSEQLKNQSIIHNNSFEHTKKKVKEHKEKQQLEFEEMINASSSKNFWQRLNQLASPLTLMIGSLGLPLGLNVAVFSAALTLAIDALSDRTITKTIASLIASGDQEQEALVHQRLETASSLITFGLTIPVGISSTFIGGVVGLSKAITGIGSQVTEMDMKTRQGRLTQIKNDAEKWEHKLSAEINKVKEVSELEIRLTKQMHEMIETQHRTMSSFIKKG